jgi:HEAT repeat protein
MSEGYFSCNYCGRILGDYSENADQGHCEICERTICFDCLINKEIIPLELWHETSVKPFQLGMSSDYRPAIGWEFCPTCTGTRLPKHDRAFDEVIELAARLGGTCLDPKRGYLQQKLAETTAWAVANARDTHVSAFTPKLPAAVISRLVRDQFYGFRQSDFLNCALARAVKDRDRELLLALFDIPTLDIDDNNLVAWVAQQAKSGIRFSHLCGNEPVDRELLLIQSCAVACVDLTQWLLEQGVEPNLCRVVSKRSLSPLAATLGGVPEGDFDARASLCDLLVRRGADPMRNLGPLQEFLGRLSCWSPADRAAFEKLARSLAPALEAILDDPSAEDRIHRRAIQLLAVTHVLSKKAVSRLLRLLKQGQHEVEMVEALGQCQCSDTRVIKSLIKYLASDDQDLQVCSAEALEQIGVNGALAIPALKRAARHDNCCVRRAAVQALGKVGVGDSSVMDWLIRRLNDDESSIAQDASIALGWLGKSDRAVVSRLIELVRSEEQSDQVRDAAAKAIIAAGPLELEYIDRLFALTQPQGVDEWSSCGHAIKAIGGLAASNESILQRLVATINNAAPSDLSVCTEVGTAAQALGYAGRIAVPICRELLSNPNPQVRQLALLSLLRVEETMLPEDLVPLVVQVTIDTVSGWGPSVLSKCGPRGFAAIESLLANTNPQVRLIATQVPILGDEMWAPIMRILLQATRDEDPTVRRAAAEGLFSESLPAAALAELTRLVRDEDFETRCWATAALGEKDSHRASHPDIVPALIEALSDPSSTDDEESDFFGRTVSSLAAESLGNLGELARDAIPTLHKLANCAVNERTRDKAVEAIKKIQAALESNGNDEDDAESPASDQG